jgi:hypothetical protein
MQTARIDCLNCMVTKWRTEEIMPDVATVFIVSWSAGGSENGLTSSRLDDDVAAIHERRSRVVFSLFLQGEVARGRVLVRLLNGSFCVAAKRGAMVGSGSTFLSTGAVHDTLGVFDAFPPGDCSGVCKTPFEEESDATNRRAIFAFL